jgi:hypothetical protein
MTKFNKDGLARRFYIDGARCIKDAEFLWAEKGQNQSSYAILLIHGIELLLKSYILLNETKELDECRKIFYGHDYKKLYEKCQEYSTELNNGDLEYLINQLSLYFYPDSITARYIEKNRIIEFYDNSFTILNNHLVVPIKILIDQLKIKK